MKRYVIGVDLGGTNLRSVLLDEKRQICGENRAPTRAQEGPAAVIEQIAGLVQEMTVQAGVAVRQVQGLGLGLPGVIDNAKGIALELPNLAGWHHVSVTELLQDRLELGVYCENDARMAAWGEKILGAGQECQNFICLTLGTGIGAGIFLQGKIWRGTQGAAGEIGHITVKEDGIRCSCGNQGCLEMYVSGRGIARRAQQALIQQESSLFCQLANSCPEQVTALTVYEAASRGDSLALGLIQETAEILGLALANLVNILNPELIILGGAVSMGWGEMLLDPVREIVQSRAFSLNKRVIVKQAHLGEKAGVLGAACLAGKIYLSGEDPASLSW